MQSAFVRAETAAQSLVPKSSQGDPNNPPLLDTAILRAIHAGSSAQISSLIIRDGKDSSRYRLDLRNLAFIAAASSMRNARNKRLLASFLTLPRAIADLQNSDQSPSWPVHLVHTDKTEIGNGTLRRSPPSREGNENRRGMVVDAENLCTISGTASILP